jgi:hypothetical protein
MINKTLIFLFLGLISGNGISQSTTSVSLPYYKVTCSEKEFKDIKEFKDLDLDQAYNLLHFDKNNHYGRFLSFTYCQEGLRLNSPIADLLLIERAQLRGVLTLKTLTDRNNKIIEEYNQKIADLYLEKGADLNNIYRRKTDLEAIQNNNGVLFPHIPTNHIEFTYDNLDFESVLKNNYGKDKLKRPLNVNKIFQGLLLIIDKHKDNGIKPHMSTVHEYSEEFMQWKKKKILNPETKELQKNTIKTTFNKLLTALATGTTSVFLATGLENKLKEWMLKQDDDSISLYGLFEQSYLLAKGDLYLTLLTIENVLSSNWLTVARNDLPLTKKLKPITYQSTAEGDKFGAWYHFWGMALFALTEGSLTASMMSIAESIISVADASNPLSNDIQEAYINLHGAKLGGKLRKLALKGKFSRKTNKIKAANNITLSHEEYMR